jgi:hypothetical protein
VFRKVNSRQLVFVAIIAVLGPLFVVGCGSSDGKLNITGKILKGGTPMTVPEEEYVRVTFFPVTADNGPPKNTYAATFERRRGTFRAEGGDGKGIPPGKYRVAVEHVKKGGDSLKGAFDGDRSPLIFDIDRQTKPLVLDLDKK